MAAQIPHTDRAQVRSKLDSILRNANDLQGRLSAPGTAAPAPMMRSLPEELRMVVDAQSVPCRDGTATPLAAPIPDSIPMTGEEDPLVEVDNPDFADVVAEFMRSERRADVAGGNSARTSLAAALLPFAEGVPDPATLIAAIEAPFARFTAAIATNPQRNIHPSDAMLLQALVAIVEGARDTLPEPPDNEHLPPS